MERENQIERSCEEREGEDKERRLKILPAGKEKREVEIWI